MFELGPDIDSKKLRRLGTIAYLGGNCPVQGEGRTYDGYPWYFRARGNRCTFEVGDDKDGDGVYGDRYVWWDEYGNDPYGAGWMPGGEALTIIKRHLRLYKWSRFRIVEWFINRVMK